MVGTRPQFVKLAPISAAMVAASVDHLVVHTGQHYDPAMSETFFAELAIPVPAVNLHVGSGGHGAQTGRMLEGIEAALTELAPDVVLVYGDTNSTIAAALAAVKMHLPVAHLEAGLRSFNRRMPEEHNRVLTDHAADLLLAPTQAAMDHLAAEGLGSRSVLVGDVMVDACYAAREAAASSAPAGDYFVATLHRAENTDDPERLAAIIRTLADAPAPVNLYAHPRLRERASQYGLRLNIGAIDVHEPLGYAEMVAAVVAARAVVTDSGGLQKEAYLLERQCTTVRSETEWVETLHDGWNVLVADPAQLAKALRRGQPTAPVGHPYGDGHASARAVEELQRWFAGVGTH